MKPLRVVYDESLGPQDRVYFNEFNLSWPNTLASANSPLTGELQVINNGPTGDITAGIYMGENNYRPIIKPTGLQQQYGVNITINPPDFGAWISLATDNTLIVPSHGGFTLTMATGYITGENSANLTDLLVLSMYIQGQGGEIPEEEEEEEDPLDTMKTLLKKWGPPVAIGLVGFVVTRDFLLPMLRKRPESA